MIRNNMIKINSRIRVVHSDELGAMRLAALAGRTGRVAERVFSVRGKLRGYMVCLDEPFEGECLWFVPRNAVADERDCR